MSQPADASSRSEPSAKLWLGLVLAIALAIAFLLPVTPNDYWWYLRLGRDTLAAGAVPTLDTFTYSQAGSSVVYHSWGSALLFWWLYQAGGITLSVLCRGALVAIAYGLLWVLLRRLGSGRLGAALVLLLAVLATSNNWSMRPQLFALPLFPISLYLLYRWQAGDRKVVLGLPLISLLWVNLHGSFILLILLILPALILPPGKGDARKPGDRRWLLAALLGVILATFINPRGAGSWTYVFQSLTVPSSQLFSAEWLPPVNDHWQMSLFFTWLLGMSALAAISPRKLSPVEWTWFLGFGFLALQGERYIIWFVFILAVLTASLLAPVEHKWIKEPKPGKLWINNLLALTFPLLTLALLPGIRQAWWSSAPATTENTPIAATRWLKERPDLAGPLWSEIGFSSYLEFALPGHPTWIDTRFEVFPVEQWQAYAIISKAGFDWEQALDDSGANLLMVSQLEQHALLDALSMSPTWCERYRDEVAVIFARCGGGE